MTFQQMCFCVTIHELTKHKLAISAFDDTSILLLMLKSFCVSTHEQLLLSTQNCRDWLNKTFPSFLLICLQPELAPTTGMC